MEKLTILNHLTRLAQIAEELDQTSPAAAQMVDETIDDVANSFGVEKSQESVVPELFPEISGAAPDRTTSQDAIDMQAEQITQNILNSVEFKEKILPLLEIGEGVEQLNDLVDETLGGNKEF